MILDRLLTGMGAVADAADRIVRRFAPVGTAGPAIAAVGLAAAAIGSLVLGLEATDNPDARILDAGAVAATTDFGNRTYSTISGALVQSYVETFEDKNFNGKQDPDETGQSWYYWLVDPETLAGVTVRSRRSPNEIYRFEATGEFQADAAYVREDIEYFKETIDEFALKVDPASIVDATIQPPSSPAAFDWSSTPSPGTVATLTGTSAGYIGVCMGDADGDGTCDDSEVDAWDVLVYEPTTLRALIVLTQVPQGIPDATFTGMLRRDRVAVDNAKDPGDPDFDFGSLGITVSADYILEDGAAPVSAPLAYVAGAGLGALAVLVVIGTAAGFVVFRPSQLLLPSRRLTLAQGERLEVRATGSVRGARGVLRVREAPMSLTRIEAFEAAPEAAPEAPPDGGAGEAVPAPTSLVVERPDRSAGLSIGGGRSKGLSVGQVVLVRRSRPALRLTSETGRLVLSFDSAADRDRAVAEILDENDLEPVGGTPGMAASRT